MNLGDERFDDSDKKPRGQILWIRGLTRLQTQVGVCISKRCRIEKKLFGEIRVENIECRHDVNC